MSSGVTAPGGLMQEVLLNSLVNITKTRDIDSLEYSLVSTIHEFIGCQQIAIYKKMDTPDAVSIERSLALYVDDDGQFQWSERCEEEEPSPELISCLHSACTISVQSNTGVENRWIPVVLQEKPVGAIALTSVGLDSQSQVLLNAFCRIFENYLAVLNENERDKLTGLLNRQTFDKKVADLMQKQVRNQYRGQAHEGNRMIHPGSTSWLAIIDVDYFKQVNDRYGHVCGDEVLLLLAQKMNEFFRASDLLFRFGGEEFVIVFEPTRSDMLRKRLDAFMDMIRSTRFPFVANITVSIGVARMSPYDFPISVLENADRALYHAKDSGRDQLHFFHEIVEILDRENGDLDGDVDLF
ncbi:signal transduction diguanylate cyclase [Oleiphilus messinensis]|uniref:diguanylate cyclase n=1 Tax=Oleiphilus messinensis TaxID=141451 RepID=A0A1Y0I4D6_9GAMM|nr:GGDEF domain-containing protein [Oleiphilus messinensis]ARU55342.1 signal transduction diguanylate cyclase [Oleiphilus messinensis]